MNGEIQGINRAMLMDGKQIVVILKLLFFKENNNYLLIVDKE